MIQVESVLLDSIERELRERNRLCGEIGEIVLDLHLSKQIISLNKSSTIDSVRQLQILQINLSTKENSVEEIKTQLSKIIQQLCNVTVLPK